MADARQALIDAIAATVAEIDDDYTASTKADILRELALAYRYAAGGPQPGNSVVEK